MTYSVYNIKIDSGLSFPAGPTAGYVLSINADGTTSWIKNYSAGSVGITVDGGGSAITTGTKGYIQVPYDGTITEWSIIADQSGSCVIDVYKSTYAGAPPTVSIAGSEKPTLSSQQKNQDTNLTTWTTSVSAGDIIGFNVDSAATITRVNVFIKINKT